MTFRNPQSGNTARIAKAYLKTQGIAITHAQALELVARFNGYTDNQAMQADTKFVDPLVLVPVSSNEFTLVGPKQTGVWLTVENISVHVKKDDDGVSVDLFALGKEDDSLGGNWLLYSEAAGGEDDAPSATCNASVQAVTVDPQRTLSDQIKAEYLASPCSRHDVNNALERLRAECSGIFEGEHSMWEFLMDEAHEDNEAT